MIVENAGWGAGSAAPIARRAFDYMLLGQYPSEEDMAAVQKGKAAAPIGKPRQAADMAGLMAAAGTNGVVLQPAVLAATKTAKAAAMTEAISKLTPAVPPLDAYPD